MTRTYADNVVDYAQAGWSCILPVPPWDKHPPPVGFTGAEGRDTDPLQLVAWAGDERFAGYSIALRMPEGVIGIDVDQYLKGETQKRGAETLAACIERWGPLPPTWTSTAREPHGPSRIYFFRVPPRRYTTKLSGPETGDVEIIQRHHRYAVVAPSPHPGAGEGATYRWYTPDGTLSAAPPKPDELAELPPAWVEGLTEGATTAAAPSADRASGERLLEQLASDWRPECADVTSARLRAVDEVARAKESTRHDVMTERTHHLVQLAAHGHTGVACALEELRGVWEQITTGEDRAEEYERALLTSARKAVSVVGGHQVPRDPCLLAQGFPLPPMAPGDPAAGTGNDPEAPDLTIAEPPRWLSAREVIGTGAFDPNAGLDQSLAEAVLQRTYPAVRYAYDSDGWLLRCPERWELHKRLSPWAVAQVAPLMPVGDPGAEKGSDPHERSKRRTRLMSTPGARAVAGKMDDLVARGMHPAAVALANLDAEPEVLWAGGAAWDLRASAEAPALAELDPATPHLHSAAVAPQSRPTPLWDAFTAAVWPDPALRAWALRVLSVTFTGYADKALPVLLGEKDRGKTQVVHLIMSVLGSYAHAADPRLLGSEGAKAHQSIVYALKGRRLSFIDEGPREGKFAQERLKQLTGGGALTANQMNQNPITFNPTHTLVLTTNDEPVLTDPAVRTRVRLIPCEGDVEAISAARAAIGYVSGPAWRTEAPGVLAALMAQAAGWLADPSSASVTAAPEGVRWMAENLGAEQDPVYAWLTEETEPFEPGTASRELYSAFVASCVQANMRRDTIPSETAWGRAVTRFGFPPVRDMRSKRRQLRIRQAGPWTPGHAGFGPEHAGFMPGSEGNPASTFLQVNPSVSESHAGYAGFSEGPTHMHTPAHAREERVPEGPKPGMGAGTEGGLTCENGPMPGSANAASPAKKPRKPVDPAKAEAATAKRAAAAEEKRLIAIAEAGGPIIELPALVTPGAEVPIGLEQAEELLATITADVTVDVEHTGYPVGHADYALRTVQLGNEHFAVVLDAGDAEQREVVRRSVAQAQILRAFSATADLVPLAYDGLGDLEAMWAKMHDTVIPAKLADPASADADADGLKQLAANLLGDRALSKSCEEAKSALFKAGKWLVKTQATTPVERSGWAQVDSRSTTMVRYAGSDVLDTAAVARVLPPVEAHLLDRERTAQAMTSRVAYRGLRLDGEHIALKLEEQRALLADSGGRLQAFGVENPGSDQQVAAVAAELGAQLPRTGTGRLSVAKGTIEQYSRAQGPLGDFVRARLDYQTAENRLGLFLEHYHQLVTRGDGRARPTVYTLGADTGRMSCRRPNLQQVPREGGFRACITADPGHLLVSADFSGVELRVAAALSQDPNLIRMLLEGVDLHWESTYQVFGPEATKADRYAVKRGNFGWLYGGRAPTLAKHMGTSIPVAQKLIDTLGTLLPGVTEWSRITKEGVEAGRTQFPTYAGRVVHMPMKAPHAAPNYCIQGTARELLIDALLRWRETRWGGCTILPVHDELVVMVPENEAAEATTALVAAMETELYGIPIVADASEPSFEWRDAS